MDTENPKIQTNQCPPTHLQSLGLKPQWISKSPLVALQSGRPGQTDGNNTNELPQQNQRPERPPIHWATVKMQTPLMKRKQEYTMAIWTFKHIQNGRFKTNTTIRRGQFVIYEPLKGKVQRFKTLHWNSVFNMGPRIYNSLPKSIRGLRCDNLFFEQVLKHFLHNIVPNDGNPILKYLPTFSNWSIPISLGKIYWDSW